MIEEEWAGVQAAFQAWLDPANFDFRRQAATFLGVVPHGLSASC